MIYIRNSAYFCDMIVFNVNYGFKILYCDEFLISPKIRQTVLSELYNYINSLDPIIKQDIKITVTVERYDIYNTTCI